MKNENRIDVGEALDQGEWSNFQKYVVMLAALTIVFDGFDNQALGIAIPELSKAWGLQPQDFKSVAAISLIAMTIGTIIAGFLGDLMGRRNALISSVLLFGVMTMATCLATDLTTLTILRFAAGLGLGGAMPNATALSAEYSPLKNRPMAVTLTIVCVPLGGLLGGLLAAQIMPTHGWQALFFVAGIIPVILGIFLIFQLPESPRYLAKDPSRHPKLRVLLSKIGREIPDDVELYDSDQEKETKVGINSLFGNTFRRDTIGLWAAFFLCLIAIYTVFSWIPSALAAAGHTSQMSSLGLAGFNFGGIFGAVGAASLIQRLGSKTTMLSLSFLGIVVAATIAIMGIGKLDNISLIVVLALLGLAINGVQTTLFALAAHVYPSTIRASGVGAALAFGRIGAILSAYIGAAVLAGGGGEMFFGLLACAMAGTFLALAFIHNHVPKAAKAVN